MPGPSFLLAGHAARQIGASHSRVALLHCAMARSGGPPAGGLPPLHQSQASKIRLHLRLLGGSLDRRPTSTSPGVCVCSQNIA